MRAASVPVRSLAAPVLLLLLSSGCSRPEAPAPAAAGTATAAVSPPPPPAGALPSPPNEFPAASFTDLQARLEALGGSGVIRLEPGQYHLTPVTDADTGCVLCPGPDWQAMTPGFTRGARLTGKGIRIVGAGADQTVIRTGSGVGLLFDGCEDCLLQGVTVRDGERDRNDQVADAAVVVRNSRVELRGCVFTDNIGAEFMVKTTFVGIGGVLVREGGEAVIDTCRIRRNSWDGVTAVRGGKVTVRNTVIDGVDSAQGQTVGGGRGPGVRIALGGEATLEGVLISRHEGGIAAYGAGRLTVRDCVLEDLPSWGVMVRPDADGGPVLDLLGLATYRTAGPGLQVAGANFDASRCRLAEVRLAFAAHRAGDAAMGAFSVPGAVDASDVLAWQTGLGGAAGDVTGSEFNARSGTLVGRLAAVPATAPSQFVAAIGAGR